MENKKLQFSRRNFLMAGAAFLAFTSSAPSFARVLNHIPTWLPGDINLPEFFPGGKWYFLNPEEVEILGAIAERLIPADELSISGKDAGCVEFIDRQLAGHYGTFERRYMQGPFHQGTPSQGDQSSLVPRERYRIGLKALSEYCQSQYDQSFVELEPLVQDNVLSGLENGDITLEGIDAKIFFSIVLQNTMEGFFADPIYGGNKDMVSWKMLGFPGARYDYRAYVKKHNQKLDIEPVSIAGFLNQNEKG
ncbi:gluconate 2-dehydrogenase subunit 3 family protein [Bartonella tamiae]|nr:gluconate 2-dehydrogenase subunit 3 family protein [Bartonella tamiae]